MDTHELKSLAQRLVAGSPGPV